jgi:glycosyltransferase involved in cell wall biosynthesis
MISNILISINTSWNILHFRTPLIMALKRQGYRVVSAAPEDVYTPRLKTVVDGHIALPMDNAGTSPFRDIALFLRYLRLLRTMKPAVMLTYTVKPNIYGALAAKFLGIPVIANVSGLGTAFIRDNWLTKVVKLLYRAAFANVHKVFFQNPEDRDLFISMKLVAPEKTVLLPGSGIDLDEYAPYTVEHQGIAFVCIARMLWDKGIGEFVEAARIVKAAYPGAKFRLVGPMGVENRTAISQEILDVWVAQGHIEYLGAVDDVRGIIAEHDCVVLPSYREGMSRVLLEGAAMGKPLIATNVAGCKQAIDPGKNGLVCEVKNAQSLADAMSYFLSLSPENRAQMGRASRAKAEREFDQKIVFEKYSEAIANAIPTQAL